MIIKNVTREILESALAAVNERFHGNIEWKSIEQKRGRTRQGGEVWSVTLKAKQRAERFARAKLALGGHTKEWIARFANSGVRLGSTYGSRGGGQKHIAAACWHAHGVFFDSLPRQVHMACGAEPPCNHSVPELHTQDGIAEVSIKSGPWKFAPGDPWNDRNIGSQAYPMMFSEACDCDPRDFEDRETVLDRDSGYMYLMG